jgi:hypothetical protein
MSDLHSSPLLKRVVFVTPSTLVRNAISPKHRDAKLCSTPRFR